MSQGAEQQAFRKLPEAFACRRGTEAHRRGTGHTCQVGTDRHVHSNFLGPLGSVFPTHLEAQPSQALHLLLQLI